MARFQKRVVCDNCGWHGIAHTTSGGSSMFLGYGSMCPECGMIGNSFSFEDFHVEVMKWISESTWWKPWTWGRGCWEPLDPNA